MADNNLVLFKKKNIRRILHNNEWWFSVVDVVAALTDSPAPRQYWGVLKSRENQLLTDCLQLKLPAADGKYYETDCANTEGIFRIIQSIPSPKAEPFKRWLARVGYERVQEVEDPELGQKRTRMLYKLKGYPDSWIEKRMRGIEIRDTLMDEWKRRGIKEQKDFEILTAEIAQATFGLTPRKHKKLKGLERENLRDHMTDLELIFSMLGEAATTEITKVEKPAGLKANKSTSRRGGEVAGIARRRIEKETGKKVVSKDNFLLSGKEARKLRNND